MCIHDFARKGDIPGLARLLDEGIAVDAIYESEPFTPLMCAAQSPGADVETLRYLIEKGADVNLVCDGQTALELAIDSAALDKMRALLDDGANIDYARPGRCDALTSAVYGCLNEHRETQTTIVRLLLERGASATGVSQYHESALSIASRQYVSFHLVPLLLAAGGDPACLRWTELMHAIAYGSASDVERLLNAGADLSARDRWSRTPWLLSLASGDVEKAKLLRAAGADLSDRGRCGRTALLYAVESENERLLSWLLELGFDTEETGDLGKTALLEAAEDGAIAMVKLLLDAGAKTQVTRPRDTGLLMASLGPDTAEKLEKVLSIMGSTKTEKAIKLASNLDVVRLLVDAGEDLSDINASLRAELTGVCEDGEIDATPEEYHAGRRRVFGSANPEVMEVAFWKAMVRSGATAYSAREKFDSVENRIFGDPVWSFRRFGKSLTELPDGRFIEIAGEHEDGYDPDFCIYNDVFVHHGGGRFEILGYPKELFPPTDFHSATLVGDYIYIIGNLGYAEERQYGETPVFRLHCGTYVIQHVETTGDNPGWISRHRARLVGESTIHITGGTIWSVSDDEIVHPQNTCRFVLDLTDMSWRRFDD